MKGTSFCDPLLADRIVRTDLLLAQCNFWKLTEPQHDNVFYTFPTVAFHFLSRNKVCPSTGWLGTSSIDLDTLTSENLQDVDKRKVLLKCVDTVCRLQVARTQRPAERSTLHLRGSTFTQVFRYVTPCYWVTDYRRFERRYHLSSEVLKVDFLRDQYFC